MEQDHHLPPPDSVGAGNANPAGGSGAEPGRDLLGPGTMVVDGRYRLASIVARNGNDTIYSALDERARNRVRLRVTADAPDPELQRLHHPAIPAVLDRGRVGRWSYVVLDWFDGAPVELPPVSNTADVPRLRAWATTAMDLLDALEHAHTTSGRAHGDINLHSLWEGSDGRFRFLDFSAPEGTLTSDRVPYASPERLRGLPREPRSDLYSLGCVLFALAHGAPPYGTDPIDARAGHLLRQLEPPSTRESPGAPFLTAPFFDILRTALEKQPHHRFASAARMRAAFQVALHELESRPAIAEQVTIVPNLGDPSSILDTVIPTDETTGKFPEPDGSDEGDAELAPDGTMDVPPDRRFSPAPYRGPLGGGTSTFHDEETKRYPRKFLRPSEPERDGPRNGVVALAIGVSVVGIVASGLAWLAAVAVLALLAARPEVPTEVSSTRVADNETLPPITVPGTSSNPPGAPSAAAVAAPSPEPPAAEPPAPAPEAVAVAPTPEPVPVAFPWNGYKPAILERFPSFVDQVRAHHGVVCLTGHTDSRGPEDVNYQMGLGRAWAVQKLLVLAGIEVVQVPIASKGETAPIADNATAEGRAANRRVTAEFFSPGQVMPEP